VREKAMREGVRAARRKPPPSPQLRRHGGRRGEGREGGEEGGRREERLANRLSVEGAQQREAHGTSGRSSNVQVHRDADSKSDKKEQRGERGK
jgi:hypothetical protein